MMQRALYLLLVVLISANACKDEPKTDFSVTFTAGYGNQELIRYKEYTFGATNFPVHFTKYNTFISDITLIKDGKETVIHEIDFLSFLPDTAISPKSKVIRRTYNNVPEGEYDAIRIGIGVKPELNKKRPADFDPNEPLYLENEYWTGWKSYIFTKIEGRGDSANDGNPDTYNVNMIYHFGSDSVYKTVTIEKPISVLPGGNGVTIHFDLEQYFKLQDGSFYNIVDNPETSNTVGEISVAQDLMKQIEQVISVQ